MACPAFYAFDNEGNLHAVQCGQWSCPTCACQLARLWAWRCRLHVTQSGGEAFFWTLTLRGKYRTPALGYQSLPNLWDNLRKRIQRQQKSWSYCAFVEGQPQRDYMPHFHVISMSKAPCRIKDLAMECGFGHQAKESMVTSGQAANYCAKYASKTNPATPKGFRRVRASQDWTKLPSFDGDPLLVKSRNELLSDFLLRVHWITGVPIDDLLYVWREKLYTDRVTNIDTLLPHDVVNFVT